MGCSGGSAHSHDKNQVGESDPRIMMRNISYSHGAFRDSSKLIDSAVKALASVDYDTMIGTGLSGALVIPILARAMGKHFAIIRKPGDSRHAYQQFEGEIGDRWIFVDDFISSGETRDRVRSVVRRLASEYNPTIFVGSYLYDSATDSFAYERGEIGKYVPYPDSGNGTYYRETE